MTELKKELKPIFKYFTKEDWKKLNKGLAECVNKLLRSEFKPIKETQ